MQRIRFPLIAALVFVVLLLAAFGGATAASFPLWFRYRTAAGLSAVRIAAQAVAGLTVVGLFTTVAIISIAPALQPTTRWRKFLYILPVYGIGLALIGVILVALRIGTVGPFAFGWLAIGGLLAVISSIIALLRLPLGERVARRALSALRVASLLGFLTGLCMIGTVLLVLTSTPSTAPNRQNDAQSQQGSQSDPGEQQEPGGPTGRQASTTPLLLGAALTTLFAGLAIASSTRGARMLHGTGSADVAVLHSSSRYEAGRALFSAAALSIVLLAVAQLIPVRRDNPPAQNAVQWDSAATQQLARRACLDCHSNETTWPWYAYVAPGSWLLRSHVSEGREKFNMSQLNNLPTARASRMPEEAVQQIRNGAMPPSDYLIMHPEAQLSEAEKEQLMQGLQQSLEASLPK